MCPCLSLGLHLVWLQSIPNIAWGKHTRVILDVGCGVASFGGFLFERDVLTMSFAPKDEHEAQVQFALERGIPAISAVMGSQRLPFPSRVFDLIHCARCRVPWHAEGTEYLQLHLIFITMTSQSLACFTLLLVVWNIDSLKHIGLTLLYYL